MLFGKANERYERLKEIFVLSDWTKEHELIEEGGFTFSYKVEGKEYDRCFAKVRVNLKSEVIFDGFWLRFREDKTRWAVTKDISLEEVIEFLPNEDAEIFLYNMDFFV